MAKYAVETSTEPIGISEYELNAFMPRDFKGALPTIEELEQGLSTDMVNYTNSFDLMLQNEPIKEPINEPIMTQ